MPTPSDPSSAQLTSSVYGAILTDADLRLGVEPVERAQARVVAITRLITRYEYMSGTCIDPARKDAFLCELQACRYSHAQFLAAERWIMRGKTRWGTLVLADFFPDEEQLASVGFDLAKITEAEYTKGFNDGRRFEKKRLEEATGMVF